jgi:predicted  nucleic acid-binding Zn-ribbon protein
VSSADLKKQINWLVKLQAVDTQIYRLQQEKKNAPLKIKELQEAFDKKKENLAILEKKGQELLRQRKDKELDCAAKEEEARKMQIQLYQLKTNKEYSARLKEIDVVKADKSVLEDAILVLMEESDKLNKEIKKEKEFLAEEEKRDNAEKQKIELRGKEIEERLSALNSQRSQIAGQVDPEVLTKYERVLVNRDYLAIVKVENNACQGCFMNVPPQVINLIKMYNNLVICEVCQRILYIEEEGIGDIH